MVGDWLEFPKATLRLGLCKRPHGNVCHHSKLYLNLKSLTYATSHINEIIIIRRISTDGMLSLTSTKSYAM